MVSFNLSPSLVDMQSTNGEGGDENEEPLYLPTHVRSIEETFDAWQESFKRPESRASVFSSGASSPYPQTPQIMEEEVHLDGQSSSSNFSAHTQESDVRPLSRMSFASVNSNSVQMLSADVRSRIGSACSVSLPRGTATGLVHEELNAEEEFKSERSFGADEMTRRLSSVVSFITDHGQVTRSSPIPENFDGEPSQSKDDAEETSSVSRKEKSATETEPIATNNNEESVLVVRVESKQNLTTSIVEKKEERDESVLLKEDTDSTKQTVEGMSTAGTEIEQDAHTTAAELPRELIRVLSAGENHVKGNYEVVTGASDEGRMPSIVETMFTGDEEGFSRRIQGSSVNSNVQDYSIEELSEELSETTEILSTPDEMFFHRHVENVAVNGETGEKNVGQLMKTEENSGNLGETECSHCQGISKSKAAIPVVSTSDGLSGKDPAQSKVLESGGESTESVLPDCTEQETVENETKIHEEAPGEMDLSSSAGGAPTCTFALLEIEQEATEMGNLAEPYVSQLDPETKYFQVEVEGSSPQKDQEKVQGSQKGSEVEESQYGSDEEKQGESEYDEGGYNTEASSTTLQGIRGVLGRRLTRCSTAATSLCFEDESALSEDGFDVKEKPYHLAKKGGFDAFKEFLLETSGEKLLQFWLEVESGRFLDDDDERNRCV